MKILTLLRRGFTHYGRTVVGEPVHIVATHIVAFIPAVTAEDQLIGSDILVTTGVVYQVQETPPAIEILLES
jgi:hypothetical protein